MKLHVTIALGPLVFAKLALAQPVDDPGLLPPPPSIAPATRPSEPTTGTRSSESPKTTQLAQPSLPDPETPPSREQVVDTRVSWVTDPTQDVDLYERVAAPSLVGPVGLYRTLTGDVGGAHHFRVGLHLGGFSQSSFLISGNSTVAGDHNSQFRGDLVIAYTPWKFLEAYVGIYNSSNRNQRNDPGRSDPEVILSLGDLALGLKGRYPVARFVDIGLHLGVRFFNSVSGVSFEGAATSFSADAIASFDLRKAQATANVPLRFHLNTGFYLDNSLGLLPSGQCAGSVGNDVCIRSRLVQSFAYGIGSNRFRLSAAIDAPIAIKKTFGIEPFLEYHVDLSIGDGDMVMRRTLSNDASISASRLTNLAQQFLTLGLRVRPIAGLILDGGVDVGLQSVGFQYGPPVAPWTVTFGAAYAYDAGYRPGKVKVVTQTIRRGTATTSRGPQIRGVVRDAATRLLLANAQIRYVGRSENAQLTAENGSFVSYELPKGKTLIEISRAGYETKTYEANLPQRSDAPVEILLTAKLETSGILRGHVVDAAGKPLPATVRLTSTTGSIIDADPEDGGGFTAKLPPGDYQVEIIAAGYGAEQRQVTIQSEQTQKLEVTLSKRVSTGRVTITKDEIRLRGKLHFASGSSTVRPDSEQLLEEVAAALIANNAIKKVRIEGHTDNQGSAVRNMMLSKARAQAVLDFLVKRGVEAARLEAEGYGSSKPLVPNMTAANRARNRRVVFHIVD